MSIFFLVALFKSVPDNGKYLCGLSSVNMEFRLPIQNMSNIFD